MFFVEFSTRNEQFYSLRRNRNGVQYNHVLIRDLKRPQLKTKNMQTQVTIYSTPTCVYCNMAKSFFKSNNINFTEYNVATDLEKRKEMIDKTGQMGVPVIAANGEIIVGFNEEKLRSVLGVK